MNEHRFDDVIDFGNRILKQLGADPVPPPSAIVNLDPPKRDVHFQLGAREMQVHLLREALLRYGQHRDYCFHDLDAPEAQCTCGLRDALTVGADLATIADVLRHPEV